MATVLITGCNRGIGFELARQYKESGHDVIGTCRVTNDKIKNLGIHIIDQIDVRKDSSVKILSEQLNNKKIDILINNAGILIRDSLENIDFNDMIEQYVVNTIGPLRITKAVMDNLKEGSKICLITSRVGSIDDNSSGGYYGYRTSKAAANMVGMNLYHDLKSVGVSIAIVHPGYVATDMTNGQGIKTSESASGIINHLENINDSSKIQFWHAEGYSLPW